jgi:hypothetical protein
MIAAAVVLLALYLHAVNWRRSGSLNWPMLVNMSGLLLLTIIGAVDPVSKRVRLAWSLVAVLLVIPSAIIVWYHGGR